MPEKSPTRLALEGYIEEYKDVPREVFINLARVATEQERKRCIEVLREKRPLLTNYNKWHEILEP